MTYGFAPFVACCQPAGRPRAGAALLAADKPKEIRVDWATYNPVSMLLKEKGFLEKEFPKDGITVRLGADRLVQQRAAVPQCRLDRFRLDRGLRRARRQDQRQPDQVGLCLFPAGMDRAGHRQGQQDHQGRGPQGQEGRDGARHRSAHLPGARAARRRPDRQGHHAGAGAAACRRRHRAAPRRRRCLGRPRSDDGAAGGRRRRQAVLSQARGQHLGHPQRARGVRQG